MNINYETIPDNPLIVTHDGLFHADEVVGISLLKFVFGHIRIIRTRDPKIIDKADFVLDVGGILDPKSHRFDHHQKSYTGHLASAGMVLDWLKDSGFIDSSYTSYLRNVFIKGVDLQDIGEYSPVRGFATFSDVIYYFNPSSPTATDKDFHTGFNEAIKFTLHFLEKLKKFYIENRRCKKKFLDQLKKLEEMPESILIVDDYIPWKEFIYEDKRLKDILLVVYPVTKKKWILHTVQKHPDKRYSDRIKLPSEWAGLLEGEFVEKTGIDDAIFCHKQRFMAAFKSREAAVKAARIAIKVSKG